MKRELRGDIIFDTSVLIELIAGTELGRKVARILIEGLVRALTSELNIAELRYVTCRKAGWARSSEIVSKLIQSGYVQILDVREFSERAAFLKCQRALSLIDCFTIAAGEVMGADVMFAKRERELESELQKRPFDTGIIFASELLN